VALFCENEIPWDQLAFPTVKQTLTWFFEDRAKGLFNDSSTIALRTRDIEPSERI